MYSMRRRMAGGERIISSDTSCESVARAKSVPHTACWPAPNQYQTPHTRSGYRTGPMWRVGM
eukprot:3354897-Rhodomonas_salina.1